MTISTVLLLIAIVFIAVAFFYVTPQNKSLYAPQELPVIRPYLSKNPLTPTETMFYHRLVEALPDYIVLAQVQLSSFLKVDSSRTEWKDYNRWFNPIAQQSVDYLICQKDFSIIAAVELDDKSHAGLKSIERDNKKNNNLDAASVPLIRWHAEAMPETEAIKQAVLKHVEIAYQPEPQKTPIWQDDELPSFLRERKNNSFPKSLVLVIGMVLLTIWSFSQISSQIAKFTVQQMPKSQPVVDIAPTKPLQNYTEQLQPYNPAQGNTTSPEASNNQAQQANQIAIEQRVKQVNENVLKEELWDREYKKKAECGESENMVDCGNKYIKIRHQFEQRWEAERSSLN